MALRHLIFILLFSLPFLSLGQQSILQGVVTSDKLPLASVSVFLPNLGIGTSTNKEGRYQLIFEGEQSIKVVFTFVGFDTLTFDVNLGAGEIRDLDVEMKEATRLLQQVEITSQQQLDPGVISINPRSLRAIPSAFGEFNRVLATLPGVVTNNELSSAYSVRGGNYDENLVYVNGMEVYRPFLVRAGRQEGLSFINSSLVSRATFYSGGWPSSYGNKLSSVLDVTYKKPVSFGSSITVGLLGGDAHIEGTTGNNRLQYLLGVRHKRSEYILNTFDVKGEYFPTFTDVQGLVQTNLGKDSPEDTQLGVLFSYAKNRYKVIPVTRETEFGTFNNAFRFLVAFEGSEHLDYDTWQTGINFTKKLSENFTIRSILSGVKTFEREYSDIEGGYRLCDLDKNPGSSTFNECISIRGLGTNYFHARNTLEGNLASLELGGELIIPSGLISGGFKYDYQEFDDYLEEYRFIDSADFVTITDNILSTNSTKANLIGGFIQHDLHFNENSRMNYGVRITYRDLNDQWLLSPRFQFVHQAKWAEELDLKASAGLYQQYPFYREMRNYSGELNTDVNAQQSVHFILGGDKGFMIWNRPFRWVSEAYYKYMWDVIPYEVDNVRLRYYGDNIATAYAVGFDTRISGEFIRGAESWFSLSLLSTKENIEINENGYVRRPTDQRVTIAAFFEDHLPNNPTMRVNLSLVMGSGLPFGPPDSFDSRTVFDGKGYNRVDVGFSKIFLIKNNWNNSIWLGLEILNLLGSQNTISYTWIQDVSNQYIAVPNTLSSRLLNIKLSYRFTSDLN